MFVARDAKYMCLPQAFDKFWALYRNLHSTYNRTLNIAKNLSNACGVFKVLLFTTEHRFILWKSI